MSFRAVLCFPLFFKQSRAEVREQLEAAASLLSVGRQELLTDELLPP